MTIETKYNKGESVYFIYDSNVYKRAIVGVIYNEIVSCKFLLREGRKNTDGKDSFLIIDESKCFSSIEEMINFYTSNQV